MEPNVTKEQTPAKPRKQGITNVPPIKQGGSTSPISLKKSQGEINDKDVTKELSGLSAEERAAYMKSLNGAIK